MERKRTSSSKKPKGGVSIFGSGENRFIFLVKINSINNIKVYDVKVLFMVLVLYILSKYLNFR